MIQITESFDANRKCNIITLTLSQDLIQDIEYDEYDKAFLEANNPAISTLDILMNLHILVKALIKAEEKKNEK